MTHSDSVDDETDLNQLWEDARKWNSVVTGVAEFLDHARTQRDGALRSLVDAGARPTRVARELNINRSWLRTILKGDEAE